MGLTLPLATEVDRRQVRGVFAKGNLKGDCLTLE